MKNTFDNIIGGTKDIADKVAQKAASAVNVSKSYVDRAQLRLKMNAKLEELGRLCYNMHKTGADESGNMKMVIKELKVLDAQLEMAEEASGKPKICAFCGGKNNADNIYCARCGERL
ncbi:MAG: hypothetical protein K2N72_11815 [Oscillospiraceae bacterium]|nr:hypothetical protein [Oscillospiraceae bacterium]